MIQNAFSPFPRVPKSQQFQHCSKAQVQNLRDSRQPLAESTFKTKTKNQRPKLHTSKITWHRVNSPIPKGRNRESRPKPHRTNIKSCSSLWSIRGKWWLMGAPEGLGRPCPFGLADCSSHDFSWAGCAPCLQLPSAVVHIPGNCMFLGSLLKFWVHTRSFMNCPVRGCLQGLQP